MSGHSKWSNIKHRKGRQDARRGQLFAKLVRAVEVAARSGGGDITANNNLSLAVAKAKAASVPRDNIDRAIARGTGEVEGIEYSEIWYEGYAPGGVALYIQCLTDNRNRAASDVRAAMNRNHGSLGEPNSVAYLFEKKGYVLASGQEDEVLMAALDGGAEDVRASGDQWEITCSPSDLAAVQRALEQAGITVDEAEVTQMPATTIPVDAATAPKVLRLVDALEDLDDVQAVYANFDIPDEIMAEVS
jgi:YebC/PmpR family DNA-binding regulatory protein